MAILPLLVMLVSGGAQEVIKTQNSWLGILAQQKK